MIVLHGIHKFGKKLVAFRNDYCNHCEAEHVAEEYQTFNMWHIFFIPLIPLGYHSRWQCTACGNDPRERTTESPTLLIIGSLLFWLVGLAMLFSIPWQTKDRLMLLCVGLGFVAAGRGLWWLYRYQAKELSTPRPEVRSLTGDTCPYCSGTISAEPYCHCSACGVRRY